MKRLRSTLLGVLAGLTLMCQSANAQSAYPRVTIGPFDLGDARLVVTGVIVGGAMLGTYFAIEGHRPLNVRGDGRHFNTGAFALTTAGCMALSPMLGAAVVWNTEGRHLTSREALGLGADCIIPFIGGILVDAAYDAHPHWR